MTPSLDETIYVDFITSSPTTGAAIDADSTPTCEVFEDNTDTAVLTPVIVKRTGKTGNYRIPIVCTVINGFEASKSYNVVVSATVSAVAAKAIVSTFQMRGRDTDDLAIPGSVMVLSAAYDAAKLAAPVGAAMTLTSAYDAAKLAAPVGAAMTLTSAYDAAKTASTQASVNIIDDFVDTEVAAIKVVTDKLDTALQLDGAVYRYTANALEMAPAGGGGGADPWLTLLPGAYTAGQAGSIVGNWLDAAVSSRAKPGDNMGLTSAYDSAKTAAQVGSAMNLTPAYDNAKVAASQASVDAILDGMAGTGGGGGGTGADPWTVALPGSYAAGTAGSILGTRLDVAVGTRATQTSVDTKASQATADAIRGKTDNLPIDPASQATVSAVKAKTDNLPADPASNTLVGAVKARTDNLPSDPASASTIATSFTGTNNKIDTVNGYVDTEVSAIKAKTDQLSFTGGKIDANASLLMSPTDMNGIADALLKRDWNLVTGEAAYSALNAFRMLRNVWNTASGTLTVKKEDGATNAWQRALTVDPAAQPIVGAS